MSAAETAAKLKPYSPGNRWLTRYVWLLYSAFFFIQPILEHSKRQWIAIAIFYPIFLFLYLWPDDGRRFSTACVFGIYALSLVYMPINQGSAGSLIYFTAFLPFIIHKERWMLSILFSSVALFCAVGIYFHVSPWSWGTVSAVASVASLANLGQARQERANQKLRRAHEEIEHLAKVAERERIARDLHDLLGHTLSMITLKAELAGKLVATEPERAAAEIRDVEETARRALTEVRQAVRGYRSEGLMAELERATHTLQTAGVKLERPESVPLTLPAAEETVAAMIVREAVTNIVRHSRATGAVIALEAQGRALVISIEDDGRGGIRQEGSGLRGMRERVESLGGTFSYDSPAGAGTCFRMTLPLSSRTRRDAPLADEVSEAVQEQPA